jgi:ribonuclease HI
VFSDASGQHGHLRAAAVALNPRGGIIKSQQICVGSIEHWSVYAAELMAIYYAISLVYQISREKQEALGTSHKPATILMDSMSALQAIANSWNKSGQRIVQAILQSARELNTRGVPIRLQWVPGHSDDLGNDTADRLAKEAVGPDKMHPFQHLLSREKRYIRRKIRVEWEQEWKASKKGEHLRQIDATLPSIRARWMYGLLPRIKPTSHTTPNQPLVAGDAWQTALVPGEQQVRMWS